MSAASRMMMSSAFVGAGRGFILVTVVMAQSLCTDWDAFQPLSSLRNSTRPQGQDKQHGTDKK